MSDSARLYPFVAIAPGRVNLLGEHVDYNDGPVLPAAIDRTVQVNFKPGTGNLVTIYATDLDEKVEFRLDQLDSKLDTLGKSPARLGFISRRGGFGSAASRLQCGWDGS